MNIKRTYRGRIVAYREGPITRHIVTALRDFWELASLAAFVTMIAFAARALGA